MIIYLYKKTHNKTGLQYLGTTTAKDPHKYQGSGRYWKSHIKKHGYDVTTEIIRECTSKEEIMEWGLHYTRLWNIVESETWANLKEECGDGGKHSKESREKIGAVAKGRTPWNKGKKIWSDEARKLISERNKARGKQSAETIEKRISKTTGKVRTDEQKARMSQAQKGRPMSEEHKAKLRGPRPHVVPHNKKNLKVN